MEARLSRASVECPFCGETNEVLLDPSAGSRQSYVEDCQVCCQPWNLEVTVDRDGFCSVTASGLE